MKNLYNCLLGLLACSLLFVACKDDEAENAEGFSIDVEEITIGENGGTEIIQVSGDAVWLTSVNAPWLKITPAGGTGAAVCEVKIDSSVVADFRTAEIRFMTQGGGEKTVSVVQAGYAKGVFVENSSEEFVVPNTAEVDERFLEITMTANIKFSVSVQAPGEWLTYNDAVPDYDYGLRPRTFKQRFNWRTNVNEVERAATITITPEEGEAMVLQVRQEAAPTITDDRAGDSLAVLAIYESLKGMLQWDSSENMRNWYGVELWRATDPEVKEDPNLLGRLKSVSFNMFDTNESLPYQVSKLRTAKSIAFYGNSNTFMKSIRLESDICELAQYGRLKSLTISAYGLVSVPDDFVKLGATLESLNLGSNNFDQTIDGRGLHWLTKENFPHLKHLSLTKINRYDTTSDLTQYASYNANDTIGYRMYTGFGEGLAWTNSNTDTELFTRLMQWDNLESLSLTLCLLQGQLPSNEELEALWSNSGQQEYYTENFLRGTEAGMTADEIAYYGDTVSVCPEAIRYWTGKPKIWPRMKSLSLNLCFLSGSLPEWMLYHPRFSEWNPLQMITQQTIRGASDKGLDAAGNEVGFNNEPTNLSNYANTGTSQTNADGKPMSYYDMYPAKKPNYGDTSEDEASNYK